MLGNTGARQWRRKFEPLHEMRHSYASTTLGVGASLIMVARALGHTGTRMVDLHPAHLAPSDMADMIRSAAPDLDI